MTATAMVAAIAAAEADAGLGPVTFMTFTDVEIAHVGMDWPASTGAVTLTLEHLQDAVTAANDDPHILIPRLKIGHVDPRFNEDPPVSDPFAYAGPTNEDGNPAYGRVDNLRLSEDGMVLVGDYVDVPDWLAPALTSAYPSRSLEGTWSIAAAIVNGDMDVKTEGGKTYSFVITSVALLGEQFPAITCLEDLQLMLTEGPTAVAAAQAARAPVNARRDAMDVAATASIDAVREQFFSEFAQGDRYWWWPIDILVDDAFVLADDDEGHLYRVPITTDADGNVSWGDPARGVLDFREVADTEPGVAARKPMFASAKAAGRPKDRVRAGQTDTGGTEVEGTVSTALLEKLGLPADATEEDVTAKIDELETAAGAAPEVEEEAVPVAASKGTVVDPDALEALQNDAKLGREARELQMKTERESIVDERIRLGALTSASRDHHIAELARGGEIEKTHRAYLANLKTGVVPIEEKGVNPSTTASDAADMEQIMASFGVKPKAGREQA